MNRGGGGNEVDGLMTICHDARVADKQPVHRPRHALIEQYLPAAAGSSSADSEVSKIWQGIGRVMDGKHSRNSSRV